MFKVWASGENPGLLYAKYKAQCRKPAISKNHETHFSKPNHFSRSFFVLFSAGICSQKVGRKENASRAACRVAKNRDIC